MSRLNLPFRCRVFLRRQHFRWSCRASIGFGKKGRNLPQCRLMPRRIRPKWRKTGLTAGSRLFASTACSASCTGSAEELERRACWISLILVPFCGQLFGEDRPNILFAIADDWSFRHAGACGRDWVKTPSFDRISRDGILFQRACTSNAKCAPSRSIIFTGRNSWQLEAARNHMCFFPLNFTP